MGSFRPGAGSQHLHWHFNFTGLKHDKAILMALKALEKQISKKPIERFTGNEYVCECPICHGETYTPNEVEIQSIQYCSWCGQKLDWRHK